MFRYDWTLQNIIMIVSYSGHPCCIGIITVPVNDFPYFGVYQKELLSIGNLAVKLLVLLKLNTKSKKQVIKIASCITGLLAYIYHM